MQELQKVDPKEFGLDEAGVATIEQAFQPKIAERERLEKEIESAKVEEKPVDTETVTIPKSEYEKLIAARDFLEALERAGVDSWEGYNYASELLNK